MNIKDPQNWDSYWQSSKNKSYLKIYDFFAYIYRNYFFRRTLVYFLKKHILKSKKILHAGAGSGQVDINHFDYYDLTAVDISEEAIKLYKKNFNNKVNIVHGSIFKLPFKNDSYDGIYNLGVMEHFTNDEISNILREFDRVLKFDGKIILFWPPEYGLAVNVLKFLHIFLNLFSHKKILLHPPEITRVKNKKQISNILKKSNFKIVDYYFGYRDFFSHTIIVAKKINK